jgi:hypothetical protein
VKDKLCYKNFINLEKGSIISTVSYKTDDRDMNFKGAKGNPIENSEILWHSCRLVAEQTDSQLSQFKLTEIVQYMVTNPSTLKTVNRYVDVDNDLTDQTVGERADDGSLKFQKDNNALLSIIATENCRAGIFFVAQHRKDIHGNPQVNEVHVNRGDSFDKVYYIKVKFTDKPLSPSTS